MNYEYVKLKKTDLLKIMEGFKTFVSEDKKRHKCRHMENDIPDLLGKYRKHLSAGFKAGSTIKDYLSQADKLLAYLDVKNIKLFELDIGCLESYLDSCRKGSRKNTYIKLLNCLRSFFKFLHSRGYIIEDPIVFIKAPKKTKPIRRPLSDMETEKIRAYLSKKEYKYKWVKYRDRLVISMGTYCGLRRQEIISIDWKDINFDEKYLLVRDSKCGKSRRVYFKEGDFLKTLSKYRKSLRIYKGAVIRGKHKKRITKCSLQNLVMEIFKGCGIYKRDEISLHSLRHTFAERLRKNNKDIAVIQAVLGHADIKQTSDYLHVRNDDLKEAAL